MENTIYTNDIIKFSAVPMLKVKLHDIRCMPARAHSTDAGADLKSIVNTIILPGDIAVPVDTGVSIAIPPGYVGAVFSRSGQGKLGVSLANGTGIIDSDYRGSIKVLLSNIGKEPYTITAFETKIAQLVVMPILLADFSYSNLSDEEWLNTARGASGFGSTG